MKKTYDLSAIMDRAWAIRRAAAEKIGCKVSEVLWGECIRMAWAEAEGRNAAANASRAAGEWAAMGESEQVKMMSACIRLAAKGAIRYSTEDHYLQFSEVPAFGCNRPHDFDEFLSETVIRVIGSLSPEKLQATNERRAAKFKKPMTLISIIYNAARASIAAVYYQDSKHGAAYDWQVENDNGEAESYVETCCGDFHENTETSAIIRADLRAFYEGRDVVDQKILDLLSLGYTEREISGLLGEAGKKISNVAVHKRIAKMRDGMTAAGIGIA